MRYLVTGAAGFVGSALVRELAGYEGDTGVVALDSFTNYYDANIKRSNVRDFDSSRVDFIEGDLMTADLARMLSGVDVVFHQAGQPGVRPSWGEGFVEYCRQNIEATQRLLEAIRSTGRRIRLVYASSSSVYGDAPRYPVVEADSVLPLSPYGVSKLAAEHLCSLYAANFGLSTVSLRYFTVYGPGQRPDMAFHKFCKSAIQGTNITVFGDGDQRRDFTFVKDIVAANIAAARAAEDIAGQVFNVCGGNSVTVNEVLHELEVIHGAKLKVVRVATMPGDVRETGGCNTKAKEALGWAPQTTLIDGLRQQYLWARGLYGNGG